VVSALTPHDGSDLIEIRGIRAHGRHGVLVDERRTGQTFIADVVLAVDTRQAASSDQLVDTVDYSVVAQAVYAELAGEPVDLLEALAERIVSRLLSMPGVRQIELTLHKPMAPVGVPVDDVILRILRSNP
jgi:dihydroneopterin aldolase